MARLITFEYQLSEKTLVADKIVRYELDALDVERSHAALTVYFQGSAEKLHLEDTYATIKAIETKITQALAAETA